MNKMLYAAAIAAVTVVLAGCAGQPAIADISQDKVQVQANGANREQIQATAEQACAMYQRRAQALSQRCADQYCMQKIVLFACIPAPASPPSTPIQSTTVTNQSTPDVQVICSYPGVHNPNLGRVKMASSDCLSSGGVVAGPAG